MPTFADDFAALNAVITRLLTQFTSGTYASSYTTYGGVDVVSEQEQPTLPEQIGKPTIVLGVDSSERSEWSGANTDWRDLTIRATVKVTGFTGAIVGASNATASDELLGKHLVREVTNNYAAFRDLGLCDIRIRPQRETVRSTATDNVQETPYIIECRYQVT